MSDGSPMSVSNQHRHSTGSDMSQHQHHDSPAQPQSQQFGQPSGTPQTPVGYPPSNDFPPPRTPLAQQGSSPSKQVPMGMGMMGEFHVKLLDLISGNNVPIFSAKPNGKPDGTSSASATIAVFPGGIGRITWHAGIAIPAALCCPAVLSRQRRNARNAADDNNARAGVADAPELRCRPAAAADSADANAPTLCILAAAAMQQQQMAQGRMVSPHMAQRPMLMRVPFPGQAYPQPMAFAPRPTPPQYPQPGGAAQQAQLTSPSFGPSFAEGVQQRGPPQFYQAQQPNAPPGFGESAVMAMGQPVNAL
ncbi:hypothetical protein AAVH_29892, partial [Aphelenchoides avenae]